MGIIKKLLNFDVVKKSAPLILTTGSIIGFGVTIFLSNRVSSKIDEIEYLEEMDVKERIQILAKYYGPSIVSGLFTVACIVSNYAVNRKREASLIGLSLLSNKFVKDYYDVVKKDLLQAKTEGEPLLKTLLDFYPKRKDDIENHEEILDDGMFFDPYYGYIFKCDANTFKDALYSLNKKFAHDGHVTLLEFYEMLDVPLMKSKEVLGLQGLGWSYDQGFIDGYVWIDITTTQVDIGDGTMCNHIVYETTPINLFLGE